MRIGVVGAGVVGRATARAWVEHCEEVRVFDVLPERATHLLDDVLECDLVFLCLPTPGKPDGTLDISILDDFCNMLGGSMIHGNYVIKSTLPIGATRRLREAYGLSGLVHSPDFVTSRCAITDAQMPAQLIIGGPYQGASGEYDDPDTCAGGLRRVYAKRFPGVPIRCMWSDESEFVKLALNSLFAITVAAWNEIHSLAGWCDGLDWATVQEAMLGDGRLSRSHCRVPGPDGKFGFGGDCLPKDATQFVSHLLKCGMNVSMTQGALLRNKWDRKR